MTEPTGPNPYAAYVTDPLPPADRPAPSAAPQGDNPYAAYAPPPIAPAAPPSRTTYSGSLLPFSRDAEGKVFFDPLNAGPIGALKRAATLPGRVQSGEVQVDPSNPAFIGETLNFAGTLGGGVNPAVRSSDYAWAGVKRTPPDPRSVATPDVNTLFRTGGRQIDEYQKAPIRYNPDYAPVMAQRIEQALIKDGVHETDAPGVYAALARLRANTGQPGDTVILEPGNLISIRKNITNQFGKPGENQHGVSIALRHIDDLIANPPPGAVLARPAAATGAPAGGVPRIGDAFAALAAEQAAHREAVAAGDVYRRGRGNYAAAERAQDLADIERAAGLRTASAHSGLNADNTLRGRITNYLLNQKNIRGHTDREVAALEAIPEGSATNNALRYASKFLGGGGGLGAGAAGALAYGAGSLVGLGEPAKAAAAIGAPIAGAALSRLAGRGTREALDETSTLLRQRSPLFQEGLRGYGAPRDPARDALARTLLRMEGQAGQGVPVDQPTLEELQARGVPRITVTPYM